MIDAFPLQWPDGWPHTRIREEARYKVGYEQSLQELLHELELLDAVDVIVSTNVPLRNDGLPYADFARRRIDDPGVAVYFKRKGDQQVIACDTWERVHHNIRAIGLTVGGLRAVQRAGASELLNRAFTGFKALPAIGGTSGGPAWWDVLGCEESTHIDGVKRCYRNLAAENHPDQGGDPGAMATINRAWEQAQKELV